MPSRSPFASRSSTSRRPSERPAQARSLESLLEAIDAISSCHGLDEIVEETCVQAKRLFAAERAAVLMAGDAPQPRVSDGRTVLVPLAAAGDEIGALALERRAPFGRADVAHAQLLARFAARAIEGARLVQESKEREAERERLTAQLITAEQDERRRLSVFLHDGPVQALAGIALMHDAALAALREGRIEDGMKVLVGAVERGRATVQALRDISFAIEPVVLRDQGFGAALRALVDQIERGGQIGVALAVEAGEELGEKAQVALYQIIREALTQAVRRRPTRISVEITRLEDGGYVATIADDGVAERRRANGDAIRERARILNARVSVEPGEQDGTLVTVTLPAYVAAARG